jgi:hypothetical protein
MSDDAAERVHARHFTVAEANALLPQLEGMLQELRASKDELTDSEAHELLSEASAGNGGGEAGRQVGVAFLEVRRLLGALEESGILLRDIDRGLLDFPALMDDREIYLCWELGEDEIGFWHDLSTGFDGRQPLD